MAIDVKTAYPKVDKLAALIARHMLKFASSVNCSMDHGRVSWLKQNNGRLRVRLELNIDDDD